jgi:hypothetical protein
MVVLICGFLVACDGNSSEKSQSEKESRVKETTKSEKTPKTAEAAKNEAGIGVFRMESKRYEDHTKSIVLFSHTRHIEKYGFQCAECHHDESGKPLEHLTMNDNVQKCIACHKIPGERPKGRDAPKLSKQERLAYHAEAIHYNCRGCHKKFNREKDTKAAPVSCSKCHQKQAVSTAAVGVLTRP